MVNNVVFGGVVGGSVVTKFVVRWLKMLWVVRSKYEKEVGGG